MGCNTFVIRRCGRACIGSSSWRWSRSLRTRHLPASYSYGTPVCVRSILSASPHAWLFRRPFHSAPFPRSVWILRDSLRLFENALLLSPFFLGLVQRVGLLASYFPSPIPVCAVPFRPWVVACVRFHRTPSSLSHSKLPTSSPASSMVSPTALLLALPLRCPKVSPLLPWNCSRILPSLSLSYICSTITSW